MSIIKVNFNGKEFEFVPVGVDTGNPSGVAKCESLESAAKKLKDSGNLATLETRILSLALTKGASGKGIINSYREYISENSFRNIRENFTKILNSK